MADFSADLPSFPILDMEPTHQFTEENQLAILGNISSTNNFHSFMPFTNDNFLTHQFPGHLAESFPSIIHQNQQQNVVDLPVSHPIITHGYGVDQFQESKTRKAMDVSERETSSMNASPQVSESGSKKRNIQSWRRGKRVKSNEEETPKEVVHVRARRGEATDSHSLAERVRRGKINERLRCLQGIVPGCYKTMGMAVMLDEIINYVQSLQNQVEFLSMKLTAASTFYDFNAEPDDMETMQGQRAREVQTQRGLREGSGLAHFHSAWSL